MMAKKCFLLLTFVSVYPHLPIPAFVLCSVNLVLFVYLHCPSVCFEPRSAHVSLSVYFDEHMREKFGLEN